MGKVYATLTDLKCLAIAAVMLPAPLWAVETTSENFVTSATLIQGNGGTGARLSYFGLQMVSPLSFAGRVTGAGATTLVDSNATWSQDQFNGTNGFHYVEFDSGLKVDIFRTDSASKTLTLTNVAAPATVGNAYRIRKHLTVADVFGKNNEAGLTPGPNSAQADNVLLQIPQSQQILTFFYSNVPGFSGWYLDNYAPGAQVVIYPEAGLMVRNKSNRNVTVYLKGSAKEGANLAPVFPGYNLLGTLKSQRSLKLSELNLYTGNPVTGVGPGGNPTAADNLILIHPDGTTAAYFYSDVVGFQGWYDTSFRTSSDVLVPAGSAFFVQRKAPRAAFYWTVPAE